MSVIDFLIPLALSVVSVAGVSHDARAADSKPVFEGNEAVTIKANGQRNVELPPNMENVAKLMNPHQPVDEGGMTVYMIETDKGLLECSVKSVDARVCRPSSLGRVKLMREWVVKLDGKWQVCGQAAKGTKGTHGLYVCSGNLSMSQYAMGRYHAKE